MRTISEIFTNYTAPSSGFSEGQIKNNPGDDTGSAVLAQWANDIHYALHRFVQLFRTGGVSEAEESEATSDFCEAFAEAMGHAVDGVSAWSSVTTYSTLGELVTYAGMQFANCNATGNLNKPPLTNPTYWYAVPRGAELFPLFSAGKVVIGDCHPIHNFNGSYYLQKFSLGQHRIGDALTGTVFNAWGVHLDGTSVGSGTELETIIEAWHLKDLLAPGSTGSRVLVDARERVLRAMGGTGGNADTLGAVQADQFQGFKLGLTSIASTSASAGAVSSQIGRNTGAGDGVVNIYADSFNDNGNGTPRTGSETRVKGLVVGVPYVVIAVAAA